MPAALPDMPFRPPPESSASFVPPLVTTNLAMHLPKTPALQRGGRWQPSRASPQLPRPKVWVPGASGYIIPSLPRPSPSSLFLLSHSFSAVRRSSPTLAGDPGTSESHLALLTMTIAHVLPDDHHHLQSIANLLGAASKIVTVTGAGISTNAGIPVSITPSSHARILRRLGLPVKRWRLFPWLPSPFLLFGVL
jgi:hypothetical protein